MQKGRYRRSLLKDVAHTATVVQHLDHIRCYIVACQAHDVKPEAYHLNDFYHAMKHTTKHVMGGCDDLAGAQQLWDLACFIAGGEEAFREEPFASVITNPISPLTIDANTLHILYFCCSQGIPVTCATAPIAGATAPMTLAGALSQMHAEALAGVAITQAFSPGAKVLYGAFPTVMDMKTMEVTMGCVEMGMMNTAAVQLAKRYDLPIYASGGVTEAKRPDIQAGFEKNFSNLTVAMAGADFVHLTAGLMDSAKSLSYEQYVIDNENVGMIYRILKGIDIDDETLAFDVIRNVGPQGHYLMEEHTLRHVDELLYPELIDRCSFDVWVAKGRPNMYRRAHARVRRILDEHPEGLFSEDRAGEIAKRFPDIRKI
jgi:trimethylamine--corrinoid protein Co-methyltransferase